MRTTVLTFDGSGDGHCAYTEAIDLSSMGVLEITRASTIEFSLRKHGRNPADFDAAQLAWASDGLTGSEIEAVFVESLYDAFDRSKRGGRERPDADRPSGDDVAPLGLGVLGRCAWATEMPALRAYRTTGRQGVGRACWNNRTEPGTRATGDQLMSREHLEGRIPSRVMSPWLSSSFSIKSRHGIKNRHE